MDRPSTRDGDFDHLLLADTLPFLLVPALHHVEAWNEAVCAGAWGERAGRRRRARSAARSTSSTGPRSTSRSGGWCACSAEVASGRRGAAAGDDRRASAETCTTPTWPRSASRREAGVRERRLPGGLLAVSQRARLARAVGSCATAAASRRRARCCARWRARPACPTRDQVAPGPGRRPSTTSSRRSSCEGRSAMLRIERTVRDEADNRSIETSLERRLA